MKQDKFLIGILAFIGLLVAAALVLFFVRGQAEPMPDDMPEGVVYNFILSLQEEDFEQAYSYMVEEPKRPSLATFEQYYQNNVDLSTLAVDFGETRLNGERASVELTITRVATDPFSDEWSETGTATLVRQLGQWKIESMPYQFWGWSWYGR